MKAPKEVKRWIAKRRHHDGKKNGVVSWLFDSPTIEVKLSKNKRLLNRSRNKTQYIERY